jgi:transcription antitermination factor NusG
VLACVVSAAARHVGCMGFWACGRLEHQREHLALRCLDLRGFKTYWPQIGGKPKPQSLFPGYLFIRIELQWHEARWSPGIVALLMNGLGPAKVGDHIILELKSREGRRSPCRRRGSSRCRRGSRVGIA